jgi:hypothetical protein
LILAVIFAVLMISVRVGRRMRNVFIRVVVFGVMVVAMEDQFRQRLQDAIQMRRRGEMDGNVVEVEGEHARHEETNPPTRLGRREASVVLFAHRHKNRRQCSRPFVVSSTTDFAPANAGRFRSTHS